jgi:hypothetical protein
MTSAVATPSSASPRLPQTVPIIILGTDALLAASPATPVQLAHACMRAGFANAIPASWGDELIAAAVLRRLPQFAGGPAIQCSCPIVAHRLLSVSGDLRPAMLGFVSPPVAIARYVRALSGTTPVRITYVGGCPGANDEAIDIRMRPDALLALLAERDIIVADQPRVFESILPPDRRRFRSLPGGVPTAELLWKDVGSRTLVEVDGEDFVGELAQQLLTGKNVLIDAGPQLGCVCAGAVAGVAVKDARASVVALEPPRAMMPIVDELAAIDLDLAVPAAARTPVDVTAALAYASPPRGVMVPVSAPVAPPPMASHRFSPIRGVAAIPEPAKSRPSGPFSQRAVLGSAPVARDGEGKSLPRAYVARRRPSPRGVPAIAVPDHPLQSPPPRPTRAVTRSAGDATIGVSDASSQSAKESAAAPVAPPTDRPTSSAIAPQPAADPAHYSTTVTPASESLIASLREYVSEPPAALLPREPRTVRPTPASVGAHTPGTARTPTRPRPSVVAEPDSNSMLSTHRMIMLGIGVLLVLCTAISAISAYVAARVVRSSTAQSAPPAAPVIAKP